MEVRYLENVPSSELYHHGIKGQRWGIRRFQNYDGTRKGAKKKNSQPQDAVNKLSTDDINDAISDTRKIMEDEKIKKYLQYSIPAVASAGIAAGSTGYAYNDIKEKKNGNKKNKS